MWFARTEATDRNMLRNMVRFLARIRMYRSCRLPTYFLLGKSGMLVLTGIYFLMADWKARMEEKRSLIWNVRPCEVSMRKRYFVYFLSIMSYSMKVTL